MGEAGSNRQAIGLLLYTGGLFGLSFPLGKIAAEAGVAPLIWALVVSMGAAGLLLPGLILQGRFRLPRGQMLRYTVISGLMSCPAKSTTRAFDARTAAGPFCKRVDISPSTDSSRVSALVTSLTSPMRCASAAPNRSAVVK